MALEHLRATYRTGPSQFVYVPTDSMVRFRCVDERCGCELEEPMHRLEADSAIDASSKTSGMRKKPELNVP